MTESEIHFDHFDLDQMTMHLASLLTLGKAHASMALPSLNRSLDHFDHGDRPSVSSALNR